MCVSACRWKRSRRLSRKGSLWVLCPFLSGGGISQTSTSACRGGCEQGGHFFRVLWDSIVQFFQNLFKKAR